MDLFDLDAGACAAPLADRMRPRSLDEFVGQSHVVGEKGLLRRALESGDLPSMILWGPPGTGKTSLVRILASESGMAHQAFSAVLSGVKEVREVVARARALRGGSARRTLLFVDEIHRFNRAQQDAFLPHVEDGTLVLAGATTQNPSFEVNSALLSRCHVFALHPLDPEDVERILLRAAEDRERGLGALEVEITAEAIERLTLLCDGDARRALNALDLAAATARPRGVIGAAEAAEAMQARALRYDKQGEEHFDLVSAFHKAVRGSDPDGAIYWLARMLASGEEPLYLARRMVRIASEDVGMADPRALEVCLAARDAFQFLGSPEGELALAEAAIYLATSPKSNAVMRALGAATEAVRNEPAEPVPLHIRNAPTRLMAEMGYGAGYLYDHDWEGALAPQTYLPERMLGRRFYEPTDRGLEAQISRRLERWRALRERGLARRKG